MPEAKKDGSDGETGFFDWDEDVHTLADGDQNKKKTALSRMKSTDIRAAQRRYCSCACLRISFAKRYVLALLGSCLFITVAVCFQHFVPQATPEEESIPGFPNYRANVQCWMWWAAALWHFVFIISMVIQLIPLLVSWWSKKFTGMRYERVKTRMEVTKSCAVHGACIDPGCLYSCCY